MWHYRLESGCISPFTYCCPEWWEIFAGSCDWHWAVHTAPAGIGRSGWSLPQSRHCHQRCLTLSFLTPTGSLLSPPLWYKIQYDLYIQEKSWWCSNTEIMLHMYLFIQILIWTAFWHVDSWTNQHKLWLYILLEYRSSSDNSTHMVLQQTVVVVSGLMQTAWHQPVSWRGQRRGCRICSGCCCPGQSSHWGSTLNTPSKIPVFRSNASKTVTWQWNKTYVVKISMSFHLFHFLSSSTSIPLSHYHYHN